MWVLCLVCDGEYVEGRLDVRREGGSLLCLGSAMTTGPKVRSNRDLQ